MGAAVLSEDTVLGPYRLVRLVGRGGMAEVYEAEVLRSHSREPAGPRRVAVKRMLPQLAADPGFVDMFCDEAVIHSRMNHRGIPRLLDFAEHGGEVIAVLELVEGSSLSRLLRETPRGCRRLPTGAALYVAHEVLEALDHAHGIRDGCGRPLGLVHRDVSPSNILVARTGEVKLIDFGIARVESLSHSTPVGTLKGKLGFMSPEQIEGRAVDARSDLFSVGVVLAELLIGERLFDGPNELALLTNAAQPCLDVLRSAEGMKAPVLAVLERALQRDPSDRYASAAAFAEGIREAAKEVGVPVDCIELCDWLGASGRPFASGVFPVVSRNGQSVGDIESVRRNWRKRVGRPAKGHRRPGRTVSGHTFVPRRAVVRSVTDRSLAEAAESLATGSGAWMRTVRACADTDGGARGLLSLARSGAFRFGAEGSDHVDERPFDRRSLPGELLRWVGARRTGLLVAESGNERRRIFLVEGTPRFVASTEPEELIGAQLVALKLVTRERVEAAVAGALRSSSRLCEILVRAGDLNATVACRALMEQTERRFLRLGRMESGELRFFAGRMVPLALPLPRRSGAELVALLERRAGEAVVG